MQRSTTSAPFFIFFLIYYTWIDLFYVSIASYFLYYSGHKPTTDINIFILKQDVSGLLGDVVAFTNVKNKEVKEA